MTQLYVAAPGGHRAKRRRTIAHNCQITYQEQGEAVTDVDVVGAQSLVLQCTAATTAAVVGKPADPCGIQPDVMPSAPYYGLRHPDGYRFPLRQQTGVEVDLRIRRQEKQIFLCDCGRLGETSSSPGASSRGHARRHA